MNRGLLVPLCLVLMPACASPELGAQSAPILNGAADTTSDAVIMVGHMVGGGMFCSGTLIAPDLVLTARHCLGASYMGSSTPVCEGTNASRFSTVQSARVREVVSASYERRGETVPTWARPVPRDAGMPDAAVVAADAGQVSAPDAASSGGGASSGGCAVHTGPESPMGLAALGIAVGLMIRRRRARG